MKFFCLLFHAWRHLRRRPSHWLPSAVEVDEFECARCGETKVQVVRGRLP